jgi:hypothetical protein
MVKGVPERIGVVLGWVAAGAVLAVILLISIGVARLLFSTLWRFALGG